MINLSHPFLFFLFQVNALKCLLFISFGWFCVLGLWYAMLFHLLFGFYFEKKIKKSSIPLWQFHIAQNSIIVHTQHIKVFFFYIDIYYSRYSYSTLNWAWNKFIIFLLSIEINEFLTSIQNHTNKLIIVQATNACGLMFFLSCRKHINYDNYFIRIFALWFLQHKTRRSFFFFTYLELYYEKQLAKKKQLQTL